MVLAGAVLAETAPALTPPRSVRESGQPPVVTRAEPEELLEKTIETSIVERGAVGEGKVAIIAPIDLLDALAGRLDVPTAGGHGGLSAADARKLLDAPLSVLSLDAARGLEFDSVVLVEPARLVEEHSLGLRALRRSHEDHQAAAHPPRRRPAPEPAGSRVHGHERRRRRKCWR